jgi:hypothetical protein
MSMIVTSQRSSLQELFRGARRRASRTWIRAEPQWWRWWALVGDAESDPLRHCVRVPAFANIRSPGTLVNLRHNANVEVNAADPFVRKAYWFKGIPSIVESGSPL